MERRSLIYRNARDARDSFRAGLVGFQRIARLGQCPVAFLLHAGDFNAASQHFSLQARKRWFNLDVSWFDEKKLHGIRLGVVGG